MRRATSGKRRHPAAGDRGRWAEHRLIAPSIDLRDVAARVDPTHVVGEPRGSVDDVAVDARRVRPGTLYVCVSGFGVDGHDFAAAAVANGAIGVVSERPLDLGVPQLVVRDGRVALAIVSDAFWGFPTEELPVVGVTGTNGKTTTTYLLHSMLEAAGLRPGLFGTIETIIGSERYASRPWTPMSFHLHRTFREMLDAGNRSCTIEATSYDSDLRRLDRVRFAALVFTNLGHDHLHYHGTIERYYAAKQRLFLDGAPAAVNVGDPFGLRLASELRGHNPLLTFGLQAEADIHPDELQLSSSGIRLRVGSLELRSPLLGSFNAENVLGAVAAARLLELPDAAIAAGVSALAGVPGRMERIDEGQPFTVFVDYAHKPEALAAVLRTARTLTDGRVISVFGCGGDCYRGKRPMMGRLAAELSDVVILTTDDPRDEDPQAIVDEIAAGGAPDEVHLDRRRAIERAITLARPADVVVVAGRGHEREQQIAGGRTRPFDDREVVREILRSTG